jgi:predicted transcriptional regulator
MRQENIQFFTDKEEEFVDQLVRSGIAKKVAMALVFLTSTKETTSREIERGADMRQSEVSQAIKSLTARGWIKTREDGSAEKGRPLKIYKLSMPISKILGEIEKEKKEEIKQQMALLGKMKEYIQ